MDTETISQIYTRVSREIESFPEFGERTSEQETRFNHLLEVAAALELVGGFLNGEYAEFCANRDANKPRASDREVFNTA
jgi:hypothetical protein